VVNLKENKFKSYKQICLLVIKFDQLMSLSLKVGGFFRESQ